MKFKIHPNVIIPEEHAFEVLALVVGSMSTSVRKEVIYQRLVHEVARLQDIETKYNKMAGVLIHHPVVLEELEYGGVVHGG